MKDSFQILDWDSKYFCFKVAKILPQKANSNKLKNILSAMKAKDIKLAYWASDPSDYTSQQAAIKYNGVLVDEKITYKININSSSVKYTTILDASISIGAYSNIYINKELEKLAIQSGAYSRYKIDTNIANKQFENLYKTWIKNSISHKIADNIFISKYKNKIVGMVTVYKKHKTGYIGLIAVNENMRGQKIGFCLVQCAHRWFYDNNLKHAEVITQKRNNIGCKLYEKCGYSVKKIENFYHFWL